MIRFSIDQPTASVPCGCVYYINSDRVVYCKEHERETGFDFFIDRVAPAFVISLVFVILALIVCFLRR